VSGWSAYRGQWGLNRINAQRVFEKRLANDLGRIRAALEPHREELAGVVIESTYNWYWLVDGLMDAGYRVHLAHPSAKMFRVTVWPKAVSQESGLVRNHLE
jgi:transposase